MTSEAQVTKEHQNVPREGHMEALVLARASQPRATTLRCVCPLQHIPHRSVGTSTFSMSASFATVTRSEAATKIWPGRGAAWGCPKPCSVPL